MAATAAKDRTRGGGGGVGMTERAVEAARRTQRGEAGNPSSRRRVPLGIHSQGPVGRAGPMDAMRRTGSVSRWRWAVTRASWLRHSKVGRTEAAGPSEQDPAWQGSRHGGWPGATTAGDGERRAACAATTPEPHGTGGAAASTGHLPVDTAATGAPRPASDRPQAPTAGGGAIARHGGAGGRRPGKETALRRRGRRGMRRATCKNSPNEGEGGRTHLASSSAAAAASSSSSSARSAHRRPRSDSGAIAPPGRRSRPPGGGSSRRGERGAGKGAPRELQGDRVAIASTSTKIGPICLVRTMNRLPQIILDNAFRTFQINNVGMLM